MGKRIVIALGGNALGENLPEQMAAVRGTARAIADLIQAGHEVVVAHGNGPQVGMIQKAMAELTRSDPERYIPCPLSVCVAMSQGYIGYDLQNVIGEELDRRGLGIHCATVLTQVAVNPADPAFQHPTKPIGAFMTEEEAKKLAAEKGIDVADDHFDHNHFCNNDNNHNDNNDDYYHHRGNHCDHRRNDYNYRDQHHSGAAAKESDGFAGKSGSGRR